MSHNRSNTKTSENSQRENIIASWRQKWAGSWYEFCQTMKQSGLDLELCSLIKNSIASCKTKNLMELRGYPHNAESRLIFDLIIPVNYITLAEFGQFLKSIKRHKTTYLYADAKECNDKTRPVYLVGFKCEDANELKQLAADINANFPAFKALACLEQLQINKTYKINWNLALDETKELAYYCGSFSTFYHSVPQGKPSKEDERFANEILEPFQKELTRELNEVLNIQESLWDESQWYKRIVGIPYRELNQQINTTDKSHPVGFQVPGRFYTDKDISIIVEEWKLEEDAQAAEIKKQNLAKFYVNNSSVGTLFNESKSDTSQQLEEKARNEKSPEYRY